MEQEILKVVISRILAKITGYSIAMIHPEPIPIGISNRHLHLSSPDLEVLFGQNHQLQLQKELRQPGQFAAVETVILAGPKGCLERVRILGPARKETQVEISLGDAFRLGINPPIRESGVTKGSSAVTIIGPKGTIQLKEGLIIAQRHIHMAPSDALKYGVTDGANVQVKLSGERGLVFDRVTVRVNQNFRLELHLDTDEANAAAVNSGSTANLLTSNLAIGVNHGITNNESSNQQVRSKPQVGSNSQEIEESLTLVSDEVVRRAWKNETVLTIREETPITPLARDSIKELGVKVIIRG
jgi:putative phosphotransacetylase